MTASEPVCGGDAWMPGPPQCDSEKVDVPRAALPKDGCSGCAKYALHGGKCTGSLGRDHLSAAEVTT